MLKAEGIVKVYGGTRALDDVDFEAQAGEIHAIVGQNGAGKSTLMSILAGEVQPDGGRIILDGAPVRMESPLRAMGLGVAMVHQRRQVVPELSVAENIFLGRLPKTALGLLDRRKLFADAKESVGRLGFDLDVRQRVGTRRACRGSGHPDHHLAKYGAARHGHDRLQHGRGGKTCGNGAGFRLDNLGRVCCEVSS